MSRRSRSVKIPTDETRREVAVRLTQRIRRSLEVYETVRRLIEDLEDTSSSYVKNIPGDKALLTHLKIIERTLKSRLEETEDILSASGININLRGLP